MPELSATYASPGLRWGLWKYDHPKADRPRFRYLEINPGNDDVSFGEAHDEGFDLPPEGWDANCLGYVLVTIDPGDESEPVRAWKEVPRQVKSFGKTVEFELTPENYEKLCTQALGRALKRAGYPSDRKDLSGLVAWRKSMQEIEMRWVGKELPAGSASAGALSAAALPGGAGDDEDEPDPADVPENGAEAPIEANVVSDRETLAASPVVLGLVARNPSHFAGLKLDPDHVAELARFCAERGIDVDADERKVRLVASYAQSLSRGMRPMGPATDVRDETPQEQMV